MTLEIIQIPTLSDNYAFLIRDLATGLTACIDTPDANAIANEIDIHKWGRLDYIFNTHWHADHAGGNEALKARFGSIIYAPFEVTKLSSVDYILKGGDSLSLGETRFEVIDLSGHTLGHIGYHSAFNHIAFIGDCVFPLGCGRLFEGTKQQMWQSLRRIAALHPDTWLYSAHEYTLSNLSFALSLGSDQALDARAKSIRALREAKIPTVPHLLRDEIATNPFFVYPMKEVEFEAQAAKFGEIRAAKDSFKT
jgi:hydroxyacylglutathione hydrolase